MQTPLKEIFGEIDKMSNGQITKNDIFRFIEKYGDVVSEATTQRAHPDSIEMESFTRRFNGDKHNGRISLPEFVE